MALCWTPFAGGPYEDEALAVARTREVAMPSLEITPAILREMEPLYARVKHVVTPMEWVHYAPLIKAINELKKQRNAVILAHNYMTPEIFHCVGDFRGDSLQLAKEAARTKADVIVQAGVHFMAETSKLLEPRQDGADPRPARRAARSPPRSRPRTCACSAPPIPACPSSPTSTPAPP